MWEPQPLATLRTSTACTGITLPIFRSLKKHCVSITKLNQLMPFKEIVAVYCENDSQQRVVTMCLPLSHKMKICRRYVEARTVGNYRYECQRRGRGTYESVGNTVWPLPKTISCSQNYGVFGLFLSSGVLGSRNTMFRKLDLFPSSGEGGEKTPHLGHFKSCFYSQEHRTMEEVQKTQ
jgi:hypothetical protein